MGVNCHLYTIRSFQYPSSCIVLLLIGVKYLTFSVREFLVSIYLDDRQNFIYRLCGFEMMLMPSKLISFRFSKNLLLQLSDELMIIISVECSWGRNGWCALFVMISLRFFSRTELRPEALVQKHTVAPRIDPSPTAMGRELWSPLNTTLCVVQYPVRGVDDQSPL